MAYATGSVIVVDTAADVVAADGHCSLREAITAANTNTFVDTCGSGTGSDVIHFQLGTDYTQIVVASPLPAITDTVTIDGATGGAIGLILMGPGMADGQSGLVVNVTAPGTAIRHLVIVSFGGNGIDISADNVTVAGCHIGTDPPAHDGFGNGMNGILIHPSGTNAHIGGSSGTSPGGACTGDCNVISGNYGFGVEVSSTGASIKGNFIGMTPTGTNPTGNIFIGNWSGGIHLLNAAGIIIGGSTPAERNLISANRGYGGIAVEDSNTVGIYGNYIGTTSDGKVPAGNEYEGMIIFGYAGSQHVTVGGSAANGNLIAFNGGDGVLIDGPNTNHNLVQFNSIHDNAGLGIELSGGGNFGRYPPIILQADLAISGTACILCTIDVYADAGSQGKTFIGETQASDSGDWILNLPATGPHITATATDIFTNTTAFSAAFSCLDYNQNGRCDAVDDIDGDGVVDALDNCILVSNPDQLDTDGDGYGNACDADLNNSGKVTAADFTLMRSVLNQLSTSSPLAAAADMNGSGKVTSADFTLLRSYLNKAPGPSGLHR